MLTKVEDFKGLYYVPNAIDVAPGSDKTGNSTELEDFIDTYEPEALDMLLGYELSTLLKPELLKKPFVDSASEDADQKWVDLVNGKDNYRGLKECLVAYIFYKFYQNDFEQYTGVGTKKLEASNSVNSSVRPRAVKAWRQLYKLAIGSTYSPTLIQGRFGVGIVYGEVNTVYKSLFTFLRESEDIYPEWVERSFKNRNQYDL